MSLKSIVGVAIKGFGKALGSGSKNTAKSKFLERRAVLRGASSKNKLDQDVKKTVKDFKKASERASKFVERRKMMGKAPIIGSKKKD